MLRPLVLTLSLAVSVPLALGERARSQPTDAPVTGAKLVETFEIEGNAVYCLALSPDGRYVAVGGREHLLEWDLRDHRAAGRWPLKGTGIGHIAFTEGGRTLVIAAGSEISLSLRDARSGAETGQLSLDRQVLTGLTVAEPRGPVVVTTGDRVRLWEPGAREPKWHVVRDSQRFMAPTLAPDGRTVAVALDRGEVRLYRAEDGKEVRRFPWVPWWNPTLRGVSFTRRGNELLVGDRDSSRIRVIDVAGTRADRDLKWTTPEPVTDPRIGFRRFDGIDALAHSPDAATVALLCNDGAIRFYETLTWGLRHTAKTVRGSSLTFTPDSRRVLVGGVTSGHVRVYDWRCADDGPIADSKAPDEVWRQLASIDAAVAYQAGVTLTRDADAGVALLGERLKPIRLADGATAERLVSDLGAAEYTVREAASVSLARLGVAAATPLLKAAASSSPEVRGRASRLLVALDRRSNPDRLRFARGLELLESVGNAGAARVLQDLAAGMPGIPESTEAQAALARVEAALQERNGPP